MNPFPVLGVPPNADDQAIRRAYLDAVKLATPESDPARFKLVAAAYDQIKDETSRCRYELFHRDAPGDSPLAAVLQHVRSSGNLQPMPFEAMKDFLRLCSKT